MQSLRTELATLYTSNWVRRVAMDLLSPIAMQLGHIVNRLMLGGKTLARESLDAGDDVLTAEDDDTATRVSEQLFKDVEFQLSLDEHELFDDYLEVSYAQWRRVGARRPEN